MVEAIMDSPVRLSKSPTREVPVLRKDIHIYSGPSATDGMPTWTLHDPARNQFFRIGWSEFEMLSRWKLASTNAIITAVNRETTLHVSMKNLSALASFLVINNLSVATGEKALDFLEQQFSLGNKKSAGLLLQKYLFFRLPLFRPDRMLAIALPWIELIYTRVFLIFVLAGLVLGLFLTIRQWESFASTFSYMYSPTGISWLVAALLLAKTTHELGHAFTAKRYGLRVPTMGVAFLVFWPVLYTDTTEAWKLAERKQRLAISAAGISAELVIAVIALLLWNILPDGPARSAVFVIATTSWVLTLFVNINPLVRFDGYYLLSDYLDIPNLQSRAFELARWKILEWLFSPGEPRPGTIPAKYRKLSIAYAWLTWIYRILLFTGIGLLVYHLLFKLAGIVLLAAVISWFILRPVYHEFRCWFAMRDRFHWNRHSMLSLLLLTAGLLLLIVPWNTQVSAPAIARYSSYYHLYPPGHGRIVEVRTNVGARVTQGQPLFLLDSPELDYRLAQTGRKIEALRLQLARQATRTSTISSSGVLQREMEKTLSEYNGFEQRRNQLTITSPLTGTVVEIAKALTPGRWVNEALQLALVVNQESLSIESYFMEEQVNQLEQGSNGRFYPDNPDRAAFDVTIREISRSAMTKLDEPFQASSYGGKIAVRPQPDGTLVPNHAIYKVRLKADDNIHTTNQILTGLVKVNAHPQSIIGRLWVTIVAVVVRESGF